MPTSRLPARATPRTSSRPAAFPPAAAKTPTRPMAAAAAKKKGSAAAAPPNHSILSFFKKVAPPEESMFVAGGGGSAIVSGVVDVDLDMDDDATVAPSPAKRRRLSGEAPRTTATQTTATQTTATATTTAASTRPESASTPESASASTTAASGAAAAAAAKQQPRRGPFLDDSDEDEGDDDKDNAGIPSASSPHGAGVQTGQVAETAQAERITSGDSPTVPGFDHCTSFEAAFHAPKETEEQTDETDKPADELLDEAALWDEDEVFEGEEFQERVYMEEQARLEAEAQAAAMADGNPQPADESVTTGCCPICSVSLVGRSPEQAAVHVNACLDSTGTSATADDAAAESKPAPPPPSLSPMANRFLRTAQPRPGQANPIGLDGGTPGMAGPTGPAGAPGGAARSAFSKLMLGHAEDAAWAAAAAAEHASRGRPAYERTCPFYKIMPGLAICVDAFRYGAIEGCRAYFLSHFHSDHYVGLTARWCHGPIYCSRVTASLVKSQLGTAAKWVVALDWETPVAVPGTDGVRVTMLPANHCPGSALFLFEKDLPQQQRTHRILHCGDFRACPAHVRHPLLRPETAPTAASPDRQQTIDVCYLDTTYLNPRYAFPPQDDVVKACAALCAALDRSLRAGDEAAWHRILHRRDGSGSGSVRAMFAAATKKTEAKDSKTNATAGEPEPEPDAEPDAENALSLLGKPPRTVRNRLLVVCGTYSIGKERLCKAVAQALGSKIYASPAKIKIVAQLGDPELTALMTPNAAEAQVHMQMLMEMRGETLAAYLASHRRHFARVVGFRPSGWNYRPATATAAATTAAPGGAGAPAAAASAAAAATPSANLPPGALPTATLLHGAGWRTRFGARDLVPQRGSTRDVLCFGVPYSEHSSFRELALFLLALRIERVVPTVNVGSDASRQRMKAWTDRWLAERRRGGLVRLRTEDDDEADADGPDGAKLWDGKGGAGGTAYW